MTIADALQKIAEKLDLRFGELRINFADGKVVHIEGDKSYDLKVLLNSIAQ